MRSANAPTISTGVMQAKVIWKQTYTSSGMTTPLEKVPALDSGVTPIRTALERTAPKATVGRRRNMKRGMAGYPPVSRYRSASTGWGEALSRNSARGVPAAREIANQLILCRDLEGRQSDAAVGQGRRIAGKQPLPNLRTVTQ